MSFASADIRRSLEPSEGFSLLETIVALGILAVVAAGVLPMALLAVTTTENQGHLLARTTEYAQDKLEQLQVLAFNDSTSDTRVFPATTSAAPAWHPVAASIPRRRWRRTSTISISTAMCSTRLVATPRTPGSTGESGKISMVAANNPTCPLLLTPNGCLKRITVSATVRAAAAGGLGLIPRATVSSLKTYPF